MASANAVLPAGDADAVAVKACIDAAFERYIERIGKPPASMLLDVAAEIAAGHVWVLRQGTAIVGALIQYETDRGFYLDTVAVPPAAQGTGVGRALLEFAEKEARRRGHASIYLCTNSKMTENQRLYPRIGYVETERKHETGYDRIYYTKALPAAAG